MANSTNTTGPGTAASTPPSPIYRKEPDGTWLKCTWNPAIQDYDCVEINASEVPQNK